MKKDKSKIKKSLKKSQKLSRLKEEKNEEYRKFLDKINFTLQEKNISKEELIKKISNKLKAIILYKSFEQGPQHDKKIRDGVYKTLGVQNISSGLSIIPPQRINQKLSEEQLLNWFHEELQNGIPGDYLTSTLHDPKLKSPNS